MKHRTQGVHHVSLTVSDVNRSASFYADVLNLRIGPEESNGRCTTDGRAHLCFGLPPHTAISGDRFDENRVGLDHVAFSVPSRAELEAVLTTLRSMGVPTAGIEFDEDGQAEYVAFRDPDNIQIEVYASDEH